MIETWSIECFEIDATNHQESELIVCYTRREYTCTN